MREEKILLVQRKMNYFYIIVFACALLAVDCQNLTKSATSSISAVRQNFAFRSGGNDMAIVFRKLQSGKHDVKLVMFQGGDNAANETEQSESLDSSNLFVLTPSKIESPCRFDGNEKVYLCTLPSLDYLLPNFTPSGLTDRYNDQLTQKVFLIEPLQFGHCNFSKDKTLQKTSWCYSVLVDGQLAHFQQQNHSNMAVPEGRLFTIAYYPDPVLQSVTLLPPNNLISVTGKGFVGNFFPEFELLASIPEKRDVFQIHCNSTFRNLQEDGFLCLFEPDQFFPNTMRDEQVEITVCFGNWSDKQNLVYFKRPTPQDEKESTTRQVPDPPVPFNNGRMQFGQRGRGGRGQGSPGGNGAGNRRTLDDNNDGTQRASPGRQRFGMPDWEDRQADIQTTIRARNVVVSTFAADATTASTRSVAIVSTTTTSSKKTDATIENTDDLVSLTDGAVTPSLIVKIVVPIGTVLILVVACITLLYCLRRTHPSLKDAKFFKVIFPNDDDKTKSNPVTIAEPKQCLLLQLLPSEMTSTLALHRIDRCRLTVGNEDIGKGFFGVVKSAILHPPNDRKRSLKAEKLPESVAVKVIQKSDNQEAMKEFFDEAIVMFSFQHPNVLSALGFVDDLDGYPAIVLPMMDGGNLHEFVRTNKEFNDTQMYDLAWQIAKGMAYLASLNLVHRDLAARNCLLNKQLAVKVSDFGLTRHSESINYEYGTPAYKMFSHHRPLPIRWLAPECLENGTFSEKSDVWSFGVLLWEMATRGERPYNGMESSRIITFLRCENGRLPMKSGMPIELYEVMSTCWNDHSSQRPTFEELAEIVKTLLEDQSHFSYCDPNKSDNGELYSDSGVAVHSEGNGPVLSTTSSLPLISETTMELTDFTDSTYNSPHNSVSESNFSSHDSFKSKTAEGN